MSILYIEDIYHKPIKDKFYFADTSFLLNCAKKHKFKKFKDNLLANGSIIVYNQVVKNELLHKLRFFLFNKYFKSNSDTFSSDFISSYHKTSSPDKIKNIMNDGYVHIFKSIFGADGSVLKKRLDEIVYGCQFYTNSDLQNKLNWNEVYTIMAMYGLDSSDAMIMNMAVHSKNFDGVISGDGDFKYCGEIDDFEVIIPDSNKPLKLNSNWKKE